MAENTLITSNRLRSSKERFITGTSGHALVNQTQFFEATSTGSFQGVRISLVASRWSCSPKGKSNCCSHETLFHEVMCGFKRRDAVNYASISGVGKTPSLRLQTVWFLLTADCCNSRISRSRIRIFWTKFQFCPFITIFLTTFVHASRSSV